MTRINSTPSNPGSALLTTLHSETSSSLPLLARDLQRTTVRAQHDPTVVRRPNLAQHLPPHIASDGQFGKEGGGHGPPSSSRSSGIEHGRLRSAVIQHHDGFPTMLRHSIPRPTIASMRDANVGGLRLGSDRRNGHIHHQKERKLAYARSELQYELAPQPSPLFPPQPRDRRHDWNGTKHRSDIPATTPVGLILATGLPRSLPSRLFRKKIGYAVNAVFPNPPRFSTNLKSIKGVVEHGTIMLPNEKCCDIFLRRFGGSARGSASVEIAKHKLRFSKANPAEHRVTRQQAMSLSYRPEAARLDAQSDYEDEEEEELECFIHFAEIGMWDDCGRFAPAWQSKEFKDHYSDLRLNGDKGIVSIRLDNQLIQISLYRLERIIVHLNDIYFESSVLPTYLADESEGYEVLRAQVGVAFTPTNEMIKYVRLPALDDEHAKVAPLSYVVKTRCRNSDALEAFVRRWQRKIADLVDYQEVERNPEMPFRTTVLKRLEALYDTISFQLAFQVQAVVLSGLLLPLEVLQLQRTIQMLDEALTPAQAAGIFHSAATELRFRRPGEKSSFGQRDFAKRLQEDIGRAVKDPTRAEQVDLAGNNFKIHAATITPAGLMLDGPHISEGNRIIRLFPGKEEYFLRVSIADETMLLMRDSREVDQDTEIFSVRMRNFLRQGLVIGGRRFNFLAFSTSSLREHTVWFVANFKQEGTATLISAQSIRDGIGNLESIRIPAKYAARMGQAFTTTPFSLRVDVDSVHRIPDYVAKNGKLFSDGCGYLSSKIVGILHDKDTRRRRRRKKSTLPTVFQVRIGGAKGVLALNTDARGYDIFLRPSMIKFQLKEGSSPKLTLEIASSADNPLPTHLNRPLIALLETLGVPPANFLRIQDKAVSSLREAVTSTSAALKLYHSAGYGTASEAASLLQSLHRILDIQGITQIPFLKENNLTCLTAALRQIKYKARARVWDAWTLMGVVDETGWLQEGQIFVQIREVAEDGQISERFLEGRCIIGRSPFLAPGDIQYANLVGKAPAKSPLNSLYNCVVFSRRGQRPLPNQLAGGDLDGDLYNVIQNPLLFPERCARAGNYDAPRPPELNRPCTIEDVIDFFLVFVQTDRLGMIADRHLILSDRSPAGVEDHDCIRLAQLASIAVDYMKTGVAPDFKAIPRVPDNAKPDYCQSEHRVETLGDAARSVESRTRWNRDMTVFYRSDKALGQLFRRIDVHSDIDQWGRRMAASMTEVAIRTKLWKKLAKWLPTDWLASDLEHEMIQVESFYARVANLSESYAPERRRYPLSENEVFMGVILSRYGTRFGAAGRSFNAHAGLRDDFQELIDTYLMEQCSSEDMDIDVEKYLTGPIIQPQTLREALYTSDSQDGESDASTVDDATGKAVISLDKTATILGRVPQGLQHLHDRARTILVRLARWVKAAERFQDERAPVAASKRAGQSTQYESAKWIAIGPLLLKFEELELWEAFCIELKLL